MEELFESRKSLAANATIPEVDAEIIFMRALFIQYEQILSDKNFRQHREWELKKHRCKKSAKFKKGQIWLEFDWIEISIVPDKSDKHTTTYDSCNREMASQLIKTLRLSNFTELCSLRNEKKCSTDNLTQKHLLYKQFLAWNWTGQVLLQ